VAVLGCGTVGSALVEILLSRADAIGARAGVPVRLVGIAVADRSKTRPAQVPPALVTEDAKGLVAREDVDLVVELIGGMDPARTLIESALRSAKPVVTGNKALLAEAGRELAELAAAHGVDLLYEAAVAGGIPVVRLLRESLVAEAVTRVVGIVNGTTNFILTEMAEHGREYQAALAEAQRLGLAERDPGADVDGSDAAAKAAILASLAFGAEVGREDVHREGITEVSSADVAFAAQLGYVVKPLAVAERVEGGPDVSVRVHPALVPRAHPLASVRGAFNAVLVEGESSGELMFYGAGAGGRPTASAVLGDVVDAARNLRQGISAPPPHRGPGAVRPMAGLETAYYLSLDVFDRPGVLAAVATVFERHGVSIRSMEQVGLGAEARLIFLTHRAREGAMQGTIRELRALAEVERVGGLLRVLDGPGPVGR